MPMQAGEKIGTDSLRTRNSISSIYAASDKSSTPI